MSGRLGRLATMIEVLNAPVARRLEEVAALLEEQGANPFRIQAYRHAARDPPGAAPGDRRRLEAAAHDGRLAVVLGLGPKRITGIIDSLEARLGRLRKGARMQSVPPEDPPVSEVLDVDREYRERAAKGNLPRIAPRAHALGRTHDWVVLYYDADGSERQCTVITSERGSLRGKRIVRGREAECARHYAASK
jgi:hypothetical protein